VVFVAVGANAQHRVTVGERAPQRAPLAGGAPAGLIHVQRRRGTDALEQVGVGLLEGVGDPGQDRVDRPGADPGAEQLLAQLDDVAARDAVTHRQHRDRGVKARPERARRNVGAQRGAPAAPAGRAANARALMLGDRDRQPWQFLDLVAHRHANRYQLVGGEQMATLTALRPVHDDLVAGRRRQQIAALALMAGLRALRSPRPILPAP
jgi:hypothetical protein